jgi:hypothetical protein
MAYIKEAVASGMWKTTAQAVMGNTSVLSGVTAVAGGANDATTPQLLSRDVIVISTCATSADSVRMPVGEAGDECIIANNGAAPCAVFPQTGGAFNGGTANAKFTITNAKVAMFKCVSPGNWFGGMFA